MPGVGDPLKRPPFLFCLVVQTAVDIVYHAFGDEDAQPLGAGAPAEVDGGCSGGSREGRQFIAVGQVFHLFDIPAFIRGVAAETAVQRLRRQMEPKRLELAPENGDGHVLPQPFVAQQLDPGGFRWIGARISFDHQGGPTGDKVGAQDDAAHRRALLLVGKSDLSLRSPLARQVEARRAADAERAVEQTFHPQPVHVEEAQRFIRQQALMRNQVLERDAEQPPEVGEVRLQLALDQPPCAVHKLRVGERDVREP